MYRSRPSLECEASAAGDVEDTIMHLYFNLNEMKKKKKKKKKKGTS